MLNNATIGRAFALALLALSLGPATRAAEPVSPVVVELFTSQGCSSCPPADLYLGELAQRPDVIALSLHVDYWNYIGWADPYATRFATARQHAYARKLNLRYVYTPEMVVNGTTEGVGSERSTIAGLIAAAEQAPPPHEAVVLARKPDGTLTVHVGAGAPSEPATVWLVGFDRERTTQVLHGENEGQTLRNYQVVRSWASLGLWRGAALDLTVPAGKATGDGGVAVLLQEGDGTGRILGAAMLRSPES